MKLRGSIVILTVSKYAIPSSFRVFFLLFLFVLLGFVTESVPPCESSEHLRTPKVSSALLRLSTTRLNTYRNPDPITLGGTQELVFASPKRLLVTCSTENCELTQEDHLRESNPPVAPSSSVAV